MPMNLKERCSNSKTSKVRIYEFVLKNPVDWGIND